MTLHEAIAKVVEARNAAGAARLVDKLRFRCGWNYERIFQEVKKACPSVTEAQWDALLYEADTFEGI